MFDLETTRQSFQLPVVRSDNGSEHISPLLDTVFVMFEFTGPDYDNLYRKECRIIGYPALLELVVKKYPIPDLDRPLFSLSMENIVTCFTGFRNRDEVVREIKDLFIDEVPIGTQS